MSNYFKRLIARNQNRVSMIKPLMVSRHATEFSAEGDLYDPIASNVMIEESSEAQYDHPPESRSAQLNKAIHTKKHVEVKETSQTTEPAGNLTESMPDAVVQRKAISTAPSHQASTESGGVRSSQPKTVQNIPQVDPGVAASTGYPTPVDRTGRSMKQQDVFPTPQSDKSESLETSPQLFTEKPAISDPDQEIAENESSVSGVQQQPRRIIESRPSPVTTHETLSEEPVQIPEVETETDAEVSVSRGHSSDTPDYPNRIVGENIEMKEKEIGETSVEHISERESANPDSKSPDRIIQSFKTDKSEKPVFADNNEIPYDKSSIGEPVLETTIPEHKETVENGSYASPTAEERGRERVIKVKTYNSDKEKKIDITSQAPTQPNEAIADSFLMDKSIKPVGETRQESKGTSTVQVGTMKKTLITEWYDQPENSQQPLIENQVREAEVVGHKPIHQTLHPDPAQQKTGKTETTRIVDKSSSNENQPISGWSNLVRNTQHVISDTQDIMPFSEKSISYSGKDRLPGTESIATNPLKEKTEFRDLPAKVKPRIVKQVPAPSNKSLKSDIAQEERGYQDTSPGIRKTATQAVLTPLKPFRDLDSSKKETIKVNIGRIEIKAVQPPTREPAPSAPKPKSRTLSLENYLKRRNRGEA